MEQHEIFSKRCILNLPQMINGDCNAEYKEDPIVAAS